MAAKSRLLVDILDLGTPKSYHGEVAKLLAMGTRLQAMKNAARKIHQDDGDNKKPFVWS